MTQVIPSLAVLNIREYPASLQETVTSPGPAYRGRRKSHHAEDWSLRLRGTRGQRRGPLGPWSCSCHTTPASEVFVLVLEGIVSSACLCVIRFVYVCLHAWYFFHPAHRGSLLLLLLLTAPASVAWQEGWAGGKLLACIVGDLCPAGGWQGEPRPTQRDG